MRRPPREEPLLCADRLPVRYVVDAPPSPRRALPSAAATLEAHPYLPPSPTPLQTSETSSASPPTSASRSSAPPPAANSARTASTTPSTRRAAPRTAPSTCCPATPRRRRATPSSPARARATSAARSPPATSLPPRRSPAQRRVRCLSAACYAPPRHMLRHAPPRACRRCPSPCHPSSPLPLSYSRHLYGAHLHHLLRRH